jgi:DNA-binding transcriptional ArsR family regulator
MMRATEDAVALAQALADPLRLDILRQLMGGPAAVSELVSATGAAQSNLSNHLALLRERRLVRAERQGRQIIYTLRDATVGELVESLARVAGAPPVASTRKTPAIMRARTCYDHLAGQLGVGLFMALVAREALLPLTPSAAEEQGAAPSAVALGPAADAVFGSLGVSLDEAHKSKRRFATACLDWTERQPHLGGALGAALWSQAISAGWVLREPGYRAVLVTPTGRATLRDRLGLAM